MPAPERRQPVFHPIRGPEESVSQLCDVDARPGPIHRAKPENVLFLIETAPDLVTTGTAPIDPAAISRVSTLQLDTLASSHKPQCRTPRTRNASKCTLFESRIKTSDAYCGRNFANRALPS